MDDLKTVGEAVFAELLRHVDAARAGAGPVVGRDGIDAVAKELDLQRRIGGGSMDLPGLLSFVRTYCDISADLHHPGYMAHQIAPSDTPGIVADMLQSVTNNIPLIYELAPAASAVDRAVYTWMLDKIGWAGTGAGTLTNGGSLGNLIALVAARSSVVRDAFRDGNPPGLVVLAPPTSHYSLRKAVAVMGLGEQAIRPLPIDEVGRIDVRRVPEVIDEVRRRGERPIALVANACATATGLYDRIGELADVCAARDVWFHVDGAHGACALLSPKLRGLLDGVERADSATWDGHKMLRTSALCTGVLFRDRAALAELFRQDASYLYQEEAAAVDPGQYTFETSKAPLGLKIFLTLAWRGEDGLREYVERQYEKAGVLWELIQERDDFEAPYRPQSNILCFRYLPWQGDLEALRGRLIDAGEFYPSSTKIGDRPYLRAALMSPATDRETLAGLLDAVARVANV